MSLSRFFENAAQPRMPHTVAEGMVKGLIIAAALLVPYDALSPIPETAMDAYSHSRDIVLGYFALVTAGAVLGMLWPGADEDKPAARAMRA